MINPYESPTSLGGKIGKHRWRPTRESCGRFLKSLTPTSVGAIIAIAIGHGLLMNAMVWVGVAGYRIAVVILVILGLPFLAPIYAVMMPLPAFLTQQIPRFFWLILVGVNSLVWGVGVLVLYRQVRRHP